jgi:hypothetical protein
MRQATELRASEHTKPCTGMHFNKKVQNAGFSPKKEVLLLLRVASLAK